MLIDLLKYNKYTLLDYKPIYGIVVHETIKQSSGTDQLREKYYTPNNDVAGIYFLDQSDANSVARILNNKEAVRRLNKVSSSTSNAVSNTGSLTRTFIVRGAKAEDVANSSGHFMVFDSIRSFSEYIEATQSQLQLTN